MQAYDAVVLAGGRGSRLGGLDKAALDVVGRDSLDRVLDAVDDAATVVVVGPERPTERPVIWCREQPAYGGPAAAVSAALDHVGADVVVLLACDVPLVDRGVVGRLLAAVGGADAAWLVDRDGRDQYLVGAYRHPALQVVRGASSLRRAFADLHVVRVEDDAGASRDMDDWEAVAAVRAAAGGRMLKEWTTALAAELGIDVEVDERLLLEVARDAAHQVARPSAPLTTFLVGYAAARAGGGPDAVAQASATAQRLAAEWAARQQPGGGGVSP